MWYQQPGHAEAQLLLFDGVQLARHDVTVIRNGSVLVRTRRLWRRPPRAGLH